MFASETILDRDLLPQGIYEHGAVPQMYWSGIELPARTAAATNIYWEKMPPLQTEMTR